jgi:phage regulator Rha-like protein
MSVLDNALGLRIEKDRVVVFSRDIANAFEKEHRRVLQDIRELKCSDEYRLHNFVLTSQSLAMPKGGTREDKFYLVTRVGLMTLVYQAGIGFIRRKLMEAGYKPFEQDRQLALFSDEDFAG